MQRGYKYIIWFAGIFTLILACQTPYINEDLDVNEQIPVVEGYLTTIDRPQRVKLYYARPYTESTTEDISEAHVTISDDNGSEIELEEYYPGEYRTEKGEFKGVIGCTYVLTIELPNGEILKSRPQLMPDTLGIDTVLMRYTQIENIERDGDGDYYTELQLGIGVYMRPNRSAVSRSYFKVGADYLSHRQEITTVIDSSDIDFGIIYNYNTLKDCFTYFQSTDLPMIGKVIPGINYDESDLEYMSHFIPHIAGDPIDPDFVQWIILADLYSTSTQLYEYNESILNQLNSPDRIYDPIPTQLVTNMYYVSDSTKTVLGFFEVSSLSRRYFSVYRFESHGAVSYQSRFLPDTLDLANGCFINSTWIDTLIVW